MSNVEVLSVSEREPQPLSPDTSQRRTHSGRQELPAELPRVERVIACAPEQCTCRACGQETTLIGYEQSEQLDVEPAKYFVLVTRREKPPAGTMKKAVSPPPLLPLYRQSAILERETDIEIGPCNARRMGNAGR